MDTLPHNLLANLPNPVLASHTSMTPATTHIALVLVHNLSLSDLHVAKAETTNLPSFFILLFPCLAELGNFLHNNLLHIPLISDPARM